MNLLAQLTQTCYIYITIKTNDMKTEAQINEEIAKVISKGCKLSEDKIRALILKKESNSSKREKRSSKKWNDREARKESGKSPSIYGDMSMHEINLMNAKNNLPSSMRNI